MCWWGFGFVNVVLLVWWILFVICLVIVGWLMVLFVLFCCLLKFCGVFELGLVMGCVVCLRFLIFFFWFLFCVIWLFVLVLVLNV